jgi:asparagine synthase (glutamine-hydrolysing)
MCGITGFTRDQERPTEDDAAILRRMLAPISYRGPDENGIYVQGQVAFGHLRLAIVDLDGGHQPRVDAATGDALVFNGEIYSFATLANELTHAGAALTDRSDTEVLFRLLQREGVEAAVQKIDGMFAFAYYEGRTGRLYLVRDRFGEKPLYYLERNGTLIFGSEPKSVLAHPLARALPIDLAAVTNFLAFEYLPGSRSLQRGLRKVLPGHMLIYYQRCIETRCYWYPNPNEAGAARLIESEKERIEHLETLFSDTVRERLIADVPVGVFLSGGIDSSLVASLVARHAPGLTAITVAMPEATYDETPAAIALARSLGLPHEIIELNEELITTAFDSLFSRMDEPLADSSLLPTHILCCAARQKFKVAIGGDGADELFAGYLSFRANRLAPGLSWLPGQVGRQFRRLLSTIPSKPSYMSVDFLLRQLSHGFGVEPARQWIACMAPFAPEELEELWKPDVRAAAAAAAEDPVSEYLARRASRDWSTAELIHLFASTYLPEDILQKVDRASMYIGLEVRTPFLGRAFAEYAMSLPSTDKLRGFSSKYLLKKLALRHIPREIVERPKHGFAVPLAQLLRGALRERVADVIMASKGPLSELLRMELIERLWSEHQTSRRDHKKKIWTLFTLATAIGNTASQPG